MARIGYNIFWVDDVDVAAHFYETAFGFKRQKDMTLPITRWIELDAGGGLILAFAEYREADQIFPTGYRRHDPKEAPVASQITIVTDDVESAFNRAVAAGAIPLDKPAAQPWGQTVGRVRDLGGQLVSIASPLN